ncbi:hypothetical protein GQ55_7G298000 [Panicum hallii var. hallii]|jgi:hypothetical protein|uniref:Wound-responsive family protein n=2 Tax=Panicum hallii TaxID=206008 RepID=A0A2T7D0R9_9POAL|nr:uncharacterized protein LOC112900941 [Panicum hallii]PAN40310.1 hypothetical protein PAHAL_7G305100 [Panicum hallii]PUZ49093.1 hypothetical protein GQ55_7G298000 [Panicum hallii var. hallii]
MASGGGKAKASSWAAAMSVGTVEALKDQVGLCRWNHAFRSVQQRARGAAAGGSGSGSGSGGNARALPSGAAAAAAARRKARQQEEELRTVMYITNWGPNN